MKKCIKKFNVVLLVISLFTGLFVYLNKYEDVYAGYKYETFGVTKFKVKSAYNGTGLKITIYKDENGYRYHVYLVNDLYDQALFKRFCDGYVDYEYPRDDKKAVDGELSTKENKKKITVYREEGKKRAGDYIGLDKKIDAFDENKKTVTIKNIPVGTYLVAVIYKTKGDVQGKYEDIKWKKVTIKEKYKVNTSYDFSGVKTGDIIRFGTYEQDRNFKNGKEPIEWIVLSKKKDKIFVMSKYILDYLPFNQEPISGDYYWFEGEETFEADWESCTLRKWLNNNFYKYSFNDTEKKMIKETVVENRDNIFTGADCGKNTRDKVFIPSLYDMTNTKYGFAADCKEDRSRSCAYAYNKGIKAEYGLGTVDGEDDAEYWLRTMRDMTHPCLVDDGGDISISGMDYVNGYLCGVRPCMYISIK